MNMTTQMKTAQDTLFGAGGLGVTNFKLFPGFNRYATPEQIAAEINKGLREIDNGAAQEMAPEVGG